MAKNYQLKQPQTEAYGMQGRQAFIQVMSKFSEDINTLMFGRVLMHLYNDDSNPREAFNHHFQFISDKDTLTSLNQKTSDLRASRVGKAKSNVFFKEQLSVKLPDYLSNDGCFFDSMVEVLTRIQYTLAGMKWIFLQNEPNWHWFLDCLIELEKAYSNLISILNGMPDFFCKDNKYRDETIEGVNKKFEALFAELQKEQKIQDLIAAEKNKREAAKKIGEDRDLKTAAIIVAFKQFIFEWPTHQEFKDEFNQVQANLDDFLRLIGEFEYFSQGMIDGLEKKLQSISKLHVDKKQASAFDSEYKEFISRLKADLFFKNILFNPPQPSDVVVNAELKKKAKSTKRKTIVDIPEFESFPPKELCPSIRPILSESDMVLAPKQKKVVKGFMLDVGALAYLFELAPFSKEEMNQQDFVMEQLDQPVSAPTDQPDTSDKITIEIEEVARKVPAVTEKTPAMLPPRFNKFEKNFITITATPSMAIIGAGLGLIMGVALAPFTGGLSLAVAVGCALVLGVAFAATTFVVAGIADKRRIEKKESEHWRSQGWGTEMTSTAAILNVTPSRPVEIVSEKGQALPISNAPKNDAVIYAVRSHTEKPSFSL